jgi:hypothetical protein
MAKIPGQFVPLHVNYDLDVAIRKAGPMAELLFVRSLVWSKRTRSCGFVSRWDVDAVGIGLRSCTKLAESLVTHGLWEVVEDGWRIRSWERWNSSEEAISAGGKVGNHRRWHVKAGKFDPDCEFCVSENASGGDRPPIGGGIGTPILDVDGDGERDIEREEPSPPAPRPDVDELCEHLLRLVTAKGVKAKITRDWCDSARLLLDRDGRDLAEAHRLIDWCQADEFWGRNILSMPTFRKQYDKLRLQASNGHAGMNGTPRPRKTAGGRPIPSGGF